MISELVALLAGVGLGVLGARWWAAAPPAEPPAESDPAPAEPPTGARLEWPADELWARQGRRWTRLGLRQDAWRPAPADSVDEPDSFGFPPLYAWAVEGRGSAEISGLLDEWTEACVAASKVAWVTGIPTGDQLLEAWARRARPSERPAVDFARWLVGELGRATRAGLHERGDAERRDPAARRLHQAASRLIRALDPGLDLVLEPPPGVGPRQRERWLADEDLATLLGNGPAAGVVQPVLVLRPCLLWGTDVLLEGEVA